eukprot:4053431-Alexandrium_andersonii.AAC.1
MLPWIYVDDRGGLLVLGALARMSIWRVTPPCQHICPRCTGGWASCVGRLKLRCTFRGGCGQCTLVGHVTSHAGHVVWVSLPHVVA